MKNLLETNELRKEDYDICVIGLGIVGFPMASLLSKHGFNVVGFDVSEKLVDDINSGSFTYENILANEWFRKKPFRATTDSRIISESNFVIVVVPTPVNDDKVPDTSMLESAAISIGKNLKKGSIVVLESTVWPGLTKEFFANIISKNSGLKLNEDFVVGHCPERIDPGSMTYLTDNTPRVLGCSDSRYYKKVAYPYQSVINAKITEVNDCKTAEATKLLENTFRDVNIALINEVAKSFENLGIDTLQVVNAASTKPYAFIPHYPGPGVGGECIPVDPYYLIQQSEKYGVVLTLPKLARKINDSMSEFVVEKLSKKLNGKSNKILVLGLTYKKNIADIRNTPSKLIINELLKRGFETYASDPYYNESQIMQFFGVKKGSLDSEYDAIIMATDHDEYLNLDKKLITGQVRTKIFFDTKNLFSKTKFDNIEYLGIGR